MVVAALLLLFAQPQIVTQKLPDGWVGEHYDAHIEVRGGKKPLKWRGEGLPPGLMLAGGHIRGIPEAAGRFVFIVEVADKEGKKDSGVFVVVVRRRQRRVEKKDEGPLGLALGWLARHQDTKHLGGEMGRWDPAGFMRRCGVPACSNPPRVREGLTVGITALAALAFLNSGSTHKTGKYAATVDAALTWLLKQQDIRGWLGKLKEGGLWYVRDWFLNHALATLFLCRLLRVSGDEALKRPALRAVRCLLEAQTPSSAWGYDGESPNIVVSCLCVMGLKEAEAAGLKFPKGVFEDAARFAKTCVRKDGSFAYGGSESAKTWASSETGCLASGVILLRLAGKDVPKRALARLRAFKVGREVDDMAAAWLVVEALRLMGDDRGEVADAIRKAVVAQQKRSGCEAGSWDPNDRWGKIGGRVYATATGALILAATKKKSKKR